MTMDPVQVAVVNQTTGLADEDFARGVEVLQSQVSADFAPVWRIDASLRPVERSRLREKYPQDWGLILVDGAPHARSLGYHDLTSTGLPLAIVFVNAARERGEDWTHPASHELLEMLADPDINLAACVNPEAGTTQIYAREVCDPCAAYEDGYEIDRRKVSDFVTPAWFQSDAGMRFAANSMLRQPFDKTERIGAPLTMTPGGYIGVFDPTISAWTVVGNSTGQNEPAQQGARLERRGRARNHWRTSDMVWTP
jgi:hypothetical protein